MTTPAENSKTPNAAVRRSHAIHELLLTRFFYGATNAEIGKAMGLNAVTVHRDMKTLEEIGYAKKTEDGRWEATNKPLQFYRAFCLLYETQKNRLDETVRAIEAGGRRLADTGER